MRCAQSTQTPSQKVSGFFIVAFFVLGLTSVSTTALFAAPISSEQALALGKNLCASQIVNPVTPVRWVVYSADEGRNVKNENGHYWLVDGQYYPKVGPGLISVIDVTIWVPKDGSAPQRCFAVLN